MTRIDIFSGFLGAGKTTLIRKLLAEAYAGEKVVLIENEFGEIGIDGGFLQEAGVEITEMNSGCICCSLVGDFKAALSKVLLDFAPDRILIEPSGVGKLSDVMGAVSGVLSEDVVLGSAVTVVDATKCRVYLQNFGEFYGDQLANAGTVILSRTDGMDEKKLALAISLIREHNADATLVTTPWDALDGAAILAAMEQGRTPTDLLEEHEHHHHHKGEECHCHDHGHHHHGEDCHCHDHEHHHEDCGCHGHHHHDHHADEVFGTFGAETAKHYTEAAVREALMALDSGDHGTVLRAKGIVAGEGAGWLHFDFVPGEINIRAGGADVTGRVCVIGADLNTDTIAALFGLK